MIVRDAIDERFLEEINGLEGILSHEMAADDCVVDEDRGLADGAEKFNGVVEIAGGGERVELRQSAGEIWVGDLG